MNIFRNMANESPEKSSTQNTEKSRNELFDFIDKLDPNTPFIGGIFRALQNLKKFFEEKLSFLFSDSQSKLSQLKNEVNGFVEKAGNNDASKTENNTTKNTETYIKPAKSSYATKKSLQTEGVKLMKDLNFEESKGLARKIFGTGAGTDLLIKMDGGKGAMIQRMIALGYHEGGLKFGRQNPDPRSGFNIGTFQIGGMRTTKADSMKKYEECFNAGAKLANQHGINVAPFHLMPPAQRDLIAHLGYIQSQRGGAATFAKLRDPNLSERELITLMHKKIQGGIRAIGVSVVSQIKTNRIDTTTLT